MKITIECTVTKDEEMPENAKSVQNRASDRCSGNGRIISEKDLRKAVEILADYFKKHSKLEIFGYMPDTKLSTFIDNIIFFDDGKRLKV